MRNISKNETEAKEAVFSTSDNVFDVAAHVGALGFLGLPVENAAYAIGYMRQTGRMSTEQANKLKNIKGARAAKFIAKVADQAGMGSIKDHMDAIRGA